MDEQKSVAERIADRFPKGGQQWENEAGEDFESVCEAEAVEVISHLRRQTPFATKYVFSDGSSISIVGDAWGIGYSRDQLGYCYGSCFCWQDDGHSDNCPENPDRPCVYSIRDPFAGLKEIEGRNLAEAIETEYEDIDPSERPAYVWFEGDRIPVPGGRCYPGR